MTIAKSEIDNLLEQADEIRITRPDGSPLAMDCWERPVHHEERLDSTNLNGQRLSLPVVHSIEGVCVVTVSRQALYDLVNENITVALYSGGRLLLSFPAYVKSTGDTGRCEWQCRGSLTFADDADVPVVVHQS